MRVLLLLAVFLVGCATTTPSMTGITMTEVERQQCAAMGCTVWTDEELRKLVAIAMGRARETCPRNGSI